MQKPQKKKALGVFPSPTISQLEYLLEERQNPDRRKRSIAIDFEDRRKYQRRVATADVPLLVDIPRYVSSG